LIYAFSKECANGKTPAGRRFLLRQLWKKRTPAANQNSCSYGRPEKRGKNEIRPSHDFHEARLAIAAAPGLRAAPIIEPRSTATVDREICPKMKFRINLNKTKIMRQNPKRLAVILAAAFPCLGVAAETALTLDAVVVSGSRVEHNTFDLPAAVDVVDAARIGADQARVNASEALAAVPGITVQNRQNYAQDLQISSRGFGARSAFGVRGIRLVADGIPASMPDGQGQVATFNLDRAERIEVLRGPMAVVYGNHAGGVIQMFRTAN
jgi:hypothetical protein